MSHSLTGATIYYRAASDTTTDLSVAIDPTDASTYTGTGASVTPATFTSPGHVYRIKARAVSAGGVLSPETAIQRFDYDIDSDNDGLIDIRTLGMFYNIRFNLAGTTYDDEPADSGISDIGITTGGPTSATTDCPTDSDGDGFFLCGYELMVDLDFALPASYASGTVNSIWCPVPSSNCFGNTTGAGFPGIGPATGTTGGFTGIFEGNDNSISNFYSRNTANTNNVNTGLFALNEGGTIRNIAVEANLFANLYGNFRVDRIGGLVGYNNRGTITESSASGSIDGGTGNNDRVGGLVGYNDGGTITASSASGNVYGGSGSGDRVGGLVGYNDGGTITASSASGSATGDWVGGLVGQNNGTGTITASYATGDVDGGNLGFNRVGGLVGYNDGGTITASYATSHVSGGTENNDSVGGLVGVNYSGTITASYATGRFDGGGVPRFEVSNDIVGRLVGQNNGTGTITASYGFGVRLRGGGGDDGTARPSGVSSARGITSGNAGSSWNNATNNTLGAWNFGTTNQTPILVYNDYDGAGGTDFASCGSDNGGYPTTIPGTTHHPYLRHHAGGWQQ